MAVREVMTPSAESIAGIWLCSPGFMAANSALIAAFGRSARGSPMFRMPTCALMWILMGSGTSRT